MRQTLFILLFTSCILTTHAQNVFPKTGNVGIGTKQPATTLQVTGTTRLGGKANYISFDTTGAFSFTGTGAYKIAGDKYVFQYGSNLNYGLFFNATASQYEFRNGLAAPVFSINTNTGATHIASNLFLDSSLYLQGTKFISLSDTNNLFIGSNAGTHTITSDNTSLGVSTLFTNTAGYANTAIGSNALYSNVSGRANTATGAYALYTNGASEANTATGAYALYNNQSGDGNTVTGANAMYLNVNGWHNTATGVSALYSNISGAFQSAYGFEALYNNNAGAFNTGLSYHALYGNTTGNYNVAVGVRALDKNSTGSNNTALGTDADASAVNLTNATVIGYNATVNASNKVVIGNSAVTVIGGQVGWSTLSDGRFKKNIKTDVPGLLFINKLQPVTYTFDAEGYERFLGKADSSMASQKAALATASRAVRTGFIAQDVEKAAQDIHYDFDGVHRPQNETDNYSLVYSDLVPSLVKSVQELSRENEELKQRLSKIETMLTSLSGDKLSGAGAINNTTADASFIEQNTPNPCRTSTVISYSLPQSVTAANLVIMNSNAVSVYQQKLPAGKGQVTVDVSRLASGTYTYFIITDGVISKGKQLMVAQ